LKAYAIVFAHMNQIVFAVREVRSSRTFDIMF